MSVILAIESSCDETSAAIIKDGHILSNVIATQTVHQQYGGVIPELASRAHQANIVPVIHKALLDANITKNELKAVAFTKGPGLLGSLLVGVSFAKSLALSLSIPLIEVQHMHAHILAHFIKEPKPNFPFLCLTVSGGHTQIVIVKSPNNMEIIGETLDDAVGEAFDKTAKMLGLPYPGGPLIDKYAQNGNPEAFKFPEVEMKGLNYSFSGIKTAFLYFLQKEKQKDSKFIENNLPDLCASMQHTLVQILLNKVKRAAKETGINRIAISGGVSANTYLRKQLARYAEKFRWTTFVPDFEYCTDNAAMIAIAAWFKYETKDFCNQEVSPNPRMDF